MRYLLLLFFLYSQLNGAYKEPLIEKAFVVYATQNYFPLLEVLLTSLHRFSQQPIIAWGVNADIPFSTEQFPKLVKQRIDVPLKNWYDVWLYKSKILLESNVKFGIYLDADAAVLSPDIDKLFDLCKFADPYPLCPIHPDDAADDRIKHLMLMARVLERSMHYVHDNVILFSSNCKPFFKEWHQTGLRFAHITPEDEKVLNVLLWKHEAKRYIGPVEYYWDKIDTILAKKIKKPVQQLFYQYDASHRQWVPDFYLAHTGYPLIMHGCKDPQKAWQLLNKCLSN
jgi:hypothetical protein